MEDGKQQADHPKKTDQRNRQGKRLALKLLLLSGVFMAMTFAVFIVYGLLAHTFCTTVMESKPVQAWLRRSFGAAFAGLGVHLAFSEK